MAEAGETPRSFAWDDPFDLDGQLGESEKLVRDKARAFAQGYLLPRAGADYPDERFDREIMTRMGGVGLLGPAIPQASARRGLAPRVPLIYRTLVCPSLLFINSRPQGWPP
jgi:alkylation response protein AidB-like acyl-CoA dehydrogenase